MKNYGYTQEQFQEAFSKVHNKSDWKAPIYAVIEASENLHLIGEAIEFFTATKAIFEPFGGKILVRAEGYRHGPAGDH